MHGGGLGSGGGLDSSGFKNRRPAIQTAMLTTEKDDDVILAEENIVQLHTHHKDEEVDSKGNKHDEPSVRFKDGGDDDPDVKDKKITLNGSTKSLWKVGSLIRIVQTSGAIIGEFDDRNHDPKNFKGTKSKAVIFKKDWCSFEIQIYCTIE